MSLKCHVTELIERPAKSLPMQGMMLYFSGSGIQIFSLGMIFMLLTGPITAVIGIFKCKVLLVIMMSADRKHSRH